MKRKPKAENTKEDFKYLFDFEINNRFYLIEKKISKKELKSLTINEDFKTINNDLKIIHKQFLKIEKQDKPVNCLISVTLKKCPEGINCIRILPCKVEMKKK